MYCPKCGEEIMQASRFCGGCGAENLNYAEAIPALTPMAETPNKRGKTKKVILIVASIAAVLLVAYLIFGGKRIDLKYDWGTDMSDILADGAHRARDSIACAANGGDVDKIEEFQNSFFDVYYYFDEDGLYKISYMFDPMDRMEYSEHIEIVARYYGDNYYTEDVGTVTWWWEDSTVVCLADGDITYYDEEHFMEELRSPYRRIKDFFGK